MPQSTKFARYPTSAHCGSQGRKRTYQGICTVAGDLTFARGRFAVLPSLMSYMKIDGARLTEICSDGKPGVCCPRFGGREEFTPRVPVYLDRMSRRYRSMLSMTNPAGATVCSQET
jgi:hypothetical protein